MDKDIVVRLHTSFEDMVRKYPDTGTEFWCARDLQMLLGYAQWRSFAAVIDKAITACEKAGYEPKDHFAHISKMVDLGSGAQREIDDIALTRYACYLLNNRDVRKLLSDRGIVPEALPPAEDVKKVERRLKSGQKNLPKQIAFFTDQQVAGWPAGALGGSLERLPSPMQIIQVGTSAGGARAKAAIAWNQETNEIRAGQFEG